MSPNSSAADALVAQSNIPIASDATAHFPTGNRDGQFFAISIIFKL